ncbi:MAG: tRNA1(Val) (adenine(37)-N6)-methyltransferase [Polyangiaceae bacterium]|jgi:tRNA1Val (adenine37-N6)-methyltransferase
MARATQDTLFGGKLKLSQPARGEGYRVNVDAILLADFAQQGGRSKVAFDLGAGVGAVSLALLHWSAVERVTLVEIDPLAAELARANLDANGWSERGEVLTEDVSVAARAHRGDAHLVVCNPPYVPPGRGRPSTVAARRRARSGDLGAFVDAARMVLGRRGRACFVYPAREMVSLFEQLRARGLEPKRMRTVRATAEDAARIVLVEAMAAKPGGLIVLPDIVERS